MHNRLTRVHGIQITRAGGRADFPRLLVRLFPNLEALSLSHNRFTRLPQWITLFSSLRRLETDHNPPVSLPNPNSNRRRGIAGAGGRKEGDHGAAVRANSREMYKLVENAVRRTVTRVSRAELLLSLRRRDDSTPRTAAATGGRRITEAPLRSLFSLSVELAQTHLLSSSEREAILDDEATVFLPSHLLEVVTTSYQCISCDRFVVTTMPDDSAWFVPPFWERVHFLNPGIVVVTPSSERSRRRDRTRRGRQGEGGDDGGEGEVVEYLEVGSSAGRGDSGTGKYATLEQRLLLAVLARQEQGSLAPPDRGSRRSSGGGGGGGGGHKNAASASRFFDSDYGSRHSRRDQDNAADDPAPPAGSSASTLTLVVGGRGPHGVGSRFCALCAASHLGMRDAVLAKLARERERDEGSEAGDGRDVVASWKCGCEMCQKERRVRGTASEEGEEDDVDERRKVVRWLRRYDAVPST